MSRVLVRSFAAAVLVTALAPAVAAHAAPPAGGYTVQEIAHVADDAQDVVFLSDNGKYLVDATTTTFYDLTDGAAATPVPSMVSVNVSGHPGHDGIVGVDDTGTVYGNTTATGGGPATPQGATWTKDGGLARVHATTVSDAAGLVCVSGNTQALSFYGVAGDGTAVGSEVTNDCEFGGTTNTLQSQVAVEYVGGNLSLIGQYADPAQHFGRHYPTEATVTTGSGGRYAGYDSFASKYVTWHDTSDPQTIANYTESTIGADVHTRAWNGSGHFVGSGSGSNSLFFDGSIEGLSAHVYGTTPTFTATAVGADDTVVGESAGDPSSGWALVWDGTDQGRALDSLVSGGAHIHLGTAWDIDDAGDITGEGIDNGDGKTYLYVAGPAPAFPAPTVKVDVPADGDVYAQDSAHPASGGLCTPGAGTTITSCTTSTGNGVNLDTSVPGDHGYTITATEADGQTASKTVHYWVAAPPEIHFHTPQDGDVWALHDYALVDYSCEADPTAPADAKHTTIAPLPGNNTGCYADFAGSLFTHPVGTHEFTATADDGLGQQTTQQIHYTVKEGATITITTPSLVDESSLYAQVDLNNLKVKAAYTCVPPADEPSVTVTSCVGPVAAGAALVGAFPKPGVHTDFPVTATDSDGVISHQDLAVYTYSFPSFAVSSPVVDRIYAKGETATAGYKCIAGNKNKMTSCTGPVASGQPLPTTVLGLHNFVIAAIEQDGEETLHPFPYYVHNAPKVSITRPVAGHTYHRAAIVTVSFSCSAGAKEKLNSCKGSVANGGHLNTKKAGVHHFSVTARDTDGLAVTKSITYTVT